MTENEPTEVTENCDATDATPHEHVVGDIVEAPLPTESVLLDDLGIPLKQAVFVELSNGQKGIFVGNAILSQPEEGADADALPTVVNIQFSLPEPNSELTDEQKQEMVDTMASLKELVEAGKTDEAVPDPEC